VSAFFSVLAGLASDFDDESDLDSDFVSDYFESVALEDSERSALRRDDDALSVR
jgi:hypothetical protein